MRRFFGPALFGFLCVGLLSAQDISAIEQRYLTLMPFNVSLTRDLSSAKANVGDPIELRYFGEIKDGSGRVLMGQKTKFFGKVTDVAKSGKHTPEARLGIVVDHVESDGKTIPMNLTFCGKFFGRHRIESDGLSGSTTVEPRTGLPEDVKLVPAANPGEGAVLTSGSQNITIATETSFLVCQLKPKPEVRETPALKVLVPSSLPAGVRLRVSLSTLLDARKVTSGQKVEMSLVSDLLGPGNTIAIPKGAVISGRVISGAGNSKTAQSRLAIVAEVATFPEGTVPLQAFVSEPPLLGSDVFSKMLNRRKDVSFDLRGIKVEELQEQNGSGFVRDKGAIQLPIGTILVLRQAE